MSFGEEWPLPGNAIFQRTLFVSVQCTGGSARGATPVANGPRHWVQPSRACSKWLEFWNFVANFVVNFVEFGPFFDKDKVCDKVSPGGRLGQALSCGGDNPPPACSRSSGLQSRQQD